MIPIDPKLDNDLSNWHCQPSGPFFELVEPPETLLAEAVPAEYLAAVRKYGGHEGFLGQNYLRLYRYTELITLNKAYGVPEYAPELFFFGSDAGEEAYAFGIGTGKVFMVPFIPLDVEHAQLIGNDFRHFVRRLAESGPATNPNPSQLGLDLYAKQPIVLGGSPTDPANRVLVAPPKHAELAVYWNKVYRRLVEQQKKQPKTT
jgi:hypothetical protein